MNEEPCGKSSRRNLLRIGGALAATASVVGLQRVGGQGAAGNPGGRIYAQAGRSGVPVPPLEVLVYTKAAFGPKPGDLERFRALPGNPEAKLKAWVEEQLNPGQLEDKAAEARVAAARFESLGKPLERLWKDYYRDVPEGDQKYERIYQPVRETQLATLLRALHSRRQLYEVLVNFWHDHFNVAPDRDERIAPGFASYDQDVIRPHALGNFRQFLKAVATHPAMLYYLDNASSSRAGPNENWSRELFELHTLGAENYLGVKRQCEVKGFAQGNPIGYVDDDVYEATRAFTGWRVDDDPDEPGLTGSGKFTFYTPWHDRFQKTVLGRLLPPDQGPMQDGKDVLEAVAEHPGTARFIARKLVRKFIADARGGAGRQGLLRAEKSPRPDRPDRAGHPAHAGV